MVAVHFASDALTATLDASRAAVVATRLAELMGLYQREPGARIDREMVRAVIAAAADQGLVEELAVRTDGHPIQDADTFHLLEALQRSPVPAAEIGALGAILGATTLQALVGASEASLRRYAASSRETPDVIAQRVHHVALIVAILRGSFNEFGIRRWFDRPHPALAGDIPSARLAGGFDPDDPDGVAVLHAATTLLA